MFSTKRYFVIEISILYEKFVSEVLCHLLEIDIENSKAFGNGSNSLSFANKLTILSDLNAIEKKDKYKFGYFSEIRNQFAHNQDAIDYTSCFAFIQMECKLLKFYKSKIHNVTDAELRCEMLFGALSNDLSEIIHKLLTSAVSKSYFEGVNASRETLFNNLIETIKEYCGNDEELYNKMSKIFKISEEKTRTQLEIKSK